MKKPAVITAENEWMRPRIRAGKRRADDRRVTMNWDEQGVARNAVMTGSVARPLVLLAQQLIIRQKLIAS